ASGTPVIASRIGGIPELVRPGLTGRLFEPGAAEELAQVAKDIFEKPNQMQVMRPVCRWTYLNKLNGQKNYPLIMASSRPALKNRSIESRALSRIGHSGRADAWKPTRSQVSQDGGAAPALGAARPFEAGDRSAT